MTMPLQVVTCGKKGAKVQIRADGTGGGLVAVLPVLLVCQEAGARQANPEAAVSAAQKETASYCDICAGRFSSPRRSHVYPRFDSGWERK